MIHLTDRSHIPAPPERIWNWFAHLDDHYLEWHPAHVDFRAIRGTPVEEGGLCFFDTRLGRYRLRTRSRVVEVAPNRYVRHTSVFPASLINAGGSFTIEPTDGGSDLIAEVWMGYEWPVLGAFLDRLIERVIPIPALRRHMAEEGHYLAQILSEES